MTKEQLEERQKEMVTMFQTLVTQKETLLAQVRDVDTRQKQLQGAYVEVGNMLKEIEKAEKEDSATAEKKVSPLPVSKKATR
jgi:uncharacterized protein (DUF3084 family)